MMKQGHDMIGNLYFKVCGLRRAEDAALAAALGADFLGFILYSKSPRHLSLAEFACVAASLPTGPQRVAVMVEPSREVLKEAQAAGFSRFQIHARHDVDITAVHMWTDTVGVDALWLAPKLPPELAFPGAWLPCANTFVVDTFHANGFGGSGKAGDWRSFAQLSTTYPEKNWVLAGGLGPDNIAMARERSGARYYDVNSGVEDAPGVKSPEKLRALVAALAR